MNDNSGSTTLASRLTFTPSQSIPATLVVRSWSTKSGGTCDLLSNGSLWKSHIAFGGRFHQLVDTNDHERIELVPSPGPGPREYIVYTLLKVGSTQYIVGRFRDGGIGAGVSFTPPSYLYFGTLAKPTIATFDVVVGVPPTGAPSPYAIYRNDAADSDLDYDGVGTLLENDLGTCEGLTGTATDRRTNVAFDCSLAKDARDTDGDGLHDDWETFGKRSLTALGLPLPQWGASPRHMDIFLEEDFYSKEAGDTVGREPMAEAAAREMVGIWAEDIGLSSAAQKAAHAAVLANPDGLPGIALHIDTGRNPDPTQAGYDVNDWGRYGNWGGHQSFPVRFGGNWDTDPSILSDERRGVFRYAFGVGSDGGQTPTGYATLLPLPDPQGVIGAHEFGHANGLKHSGVGVSSQNCKPHYASIMNYAYQARGIGFSDLSDLAPTTLNATGLIEYHPPGVTPPFLAMLKQYYGLDYNDDGVDWNRDGQIAPQGQAVRAKLNAVPTLANTGCESTGQNEQVLRPASGTWLGLKATPSIALARLGGLNYLFESWGGGIQYFTSSTMICSGDKCWGDPKTLLTGVDAFDVTRLPDNSALLVVYRTGTQLFQRQLSGNGTLSAPTLIAANADGEPALANWGPSPAPVLPRLAYRGTDNYLYFSSRANGVFPTPTKTGVLLAPVSSPALAAGNPDGLGDRLFAAVGVPAGADRPDVGLQQLYVLNGSTFTDTRYLAGTTYGKPGLAWVPPDGTGTPKNGKMYIAFRKSPDPQHEKYPSLQYGELGRDSLTSTRLSFRIEEFHNAWWNAASVDFFFEPGVDTHLRSAHALLAYSDTTDWTHLETVVRPLADGIVDGDQTVSSDWPVLRRNVCLQLVSRSPDPVSCPGQPANLLVPERGS